MKQCGSCGRPPDDQCDFCRSFNPRWDSDGLMGSALSIPDHSCTMARVAELVDAADLKAVALP
jgi:hypothetical protein